MRSISSAGRRQSSARRASQRSTALPGPIFLPPPSAPSIETDVAAGLSSVALSGALEACATDRPTRRMSARRASQLSSRLPGPFDSPAPKARVSFSAECGSTDMCNERRGSSVPALPLASTEPAVRRRSAGAPHLELGGEAPRSSESRRPSQLAAPGSGVRLMDMSNAGRRPSAFVAQLTNHEDAVNDNVRVCV